MQYNAVDWDLRVARDGYCTILCEPTRSKGCLNAEGSIS